MIGYTRAVPSTIIRCELTHLAREPIDLGLAQAQHQQYENALRAAGVDVERLPARDDLPDSVFVEDTAVVVDEIAVVTRPGSLARRDEVESVRDALAKHRTIASIEAPATLDGGDVLVLGRDVLVGLTPRSNLSGMQQLRALLIPFGYSVRAVPVRGCLHLKSAVTRAGAQVLVANPSWVDPALMPGWEVVPVDPREPFAGNVLWLGTTTVVAEAFPRTNAALARVTDSELAAVPAGELAKAEGGVTCCSILLRNS
ncbi:MAG TPA: N(G),N(G)-dimethylarginine dimethylaminohydrolase [Gemmatimonadaceae bacterium]